MTPEQIVDSILSNDYLKIDRRLIRAFKSITFAAYVSELFFRYKGIKRLGQLQKDGSFFFTRKDVEKILFISDTTQKKYTEELVERNIVTTKLIGTSSFNSKLYYSINFENLLKLMNDFSQDENS